MIFLSWFWKAGRRWWPFGIVVVVVVAARGKKSMPWRSLLVYHLLNGVGNLQQQKKDKLAFTRIGYAT